MSDGVPRVWQKDEVETLTVDCDADVIISLPANIKRMQLYFAGAMPLDIDPPPTNVIANTVQGASFASLISGKNPRSKYSKYVKVDPKEDWLFGWEESPHEVHITGDPDCSGASMQLSLAQSVPGTEGAGMWQHQAEELTLSKVVSNAIATPPPTTTPPTLASMPSSVDWANVPAAEAAAKQLAQTQVKSYEENIAVGYRVPSAWSFAGAVATVVATVVGLALVVGASQRIGRHHPEPFLPPNE